MFTRVFNYRGQLLPPAEWPEQIAATVASIEVASRGGKNDGLTVTRIRLWPKMQALELLARHYGLLDEHVETQPLTASTIVIMPPLEAKPMPPEKSAEPHTNIEIIPPDMTGTDPGQVIRIMPPELPTNGSGPA